jgi:hypothetical protein
LVVVVLVHLQRHQQVVLAVTPLLGLSHQLAVAAVALEALTLAQVLAAVQAVAVDTETH